MKCSCVTSHRTTREEGGQGGSQTAASSRPMNKLCARILIMYICATVMEEKYFVPVCYNYVINSESAMAEETRMRVSQNGRVVIPASFRKALGINVGDEVLLRVEDDELRITTQQRRIRRAQRRAQRYVKPGASLVAELLAERREAAKNE